MLSAPRFDISQVFTVQSYDHETLRSNPEVLDRVLSPTFGPESIEEVKRRIMQILEVSSAARGRAPRVPDDDDTHCRHLLLFVWPESGRLAFLAVTNAELQEYREGNGYREGRGHHSLGNVMYHYGRVLERLFSKYGPFDVRGWPVWGLSVPDLRWGSLPETREHAPDFFL